MMTLSPFVKLSTGIGHSLLMPMTGLSIIPSGFRVIHVMLKSWVTVAAAAWPASQLAMENVNNDRAMVDNTNGRGMEV